MVFGDSIGIARRFARDLAEQGERRGLIGPQEVGRLWTRHLINCGLVAPYLVPGASVADIGSGAGLPGLVLACVRPDVKMTLIEPMERRCSWLQEEADRLGLTNVRVLQRRAQEAVTCGPFEQVTARAVSALRTLIPIAAPLARVGGELLFLKGERINAEITEATTVLQRFAVRNIAVEELGGRLVPEVTRLFRATVGGAP